MFSSAQLVGLYVFTLFIVWGVLSKIMDIIRFNKECKLWMTYYECVSRLGAPIMVPKFGGVQKKTNKKGEKEDGHNDSK